MALPCTTWIHKQTPHNVKLSKTTTPIPMAQQPVVGQSYPGFTIILRHNILLWTQRPLLNNTQHSQQTDRQTDIHVPCRETLVSILEDAGWAPRTVWTGAEKLAHAGIQSPDRPAHSESVYRLSYRGPNIYEWLYEIKCANYNVKN